MAINVYTAKTPDELFTHLVENKGDRLALFTVDCCQTKKITELSLENTRSVFNACVEVIGRSQFQRGTRSFLLNIQGVKRDVVISMTSLSVQVSGNLK